MSPDEILNRAIRELAYSVKNWPDHQKKPIFRFVNVIQELISDHEMECLSYDVAIRKHIAQERILLMIMETYGIDISLALGRRDDQIFSDHDLATNLNIVRVPEKIGYERIQPTPGSN
jgi:hypothetical protein